MARLRAEIKRGFLRTLWRQATGAGVTVEDLLGQFQDNGFQWIKSGRIVLSTSGGGYTSNFSNTETTRELTQEELFAFSEELWAIHDDVLAGTPGLAGDALIAAMIGDGRMQTVRQVMNDYSLIRYPTYGPTR